MSTGTTDTYDPDRRGRTRYAARISVNFRHGDSYLYCRTSNVSELGIFLVSDNPLPPGTHLELEFNLPGRRHPICVKGQVRWTETGGGEAEPGMGVELIDLDKESQARIRSLIRTFAYLE